MAKIAILSYDMIFNPGEAWTSGYEFESQLADFFATKGIEAEIVETSGGTGRRVIYLTKGQPVMTNPAPKQPEAPKRTVQPPPKDFKQFQDRGVPKSLVNQDKRSPKLNFDPRGRANRQKVRYG